MEVLAPSLRLVQSVRYSMEAGDSVRIGVREYLSQPKDSFSRDVAAWMTLLERGCGTQEFLQKIQNPIRRQVLILLERGIAGEPILTALVAMDDEIQEQSLLQIESFLAQLPFRMMIPLLFFVFPAFLVLLLGPLLLRILDGLA